MTGCIRKSIRHRIPLPIRAHEIVICCTSGWLVLLAMLITSHGYNILIVSFRYYRPARPIDPPAESIIIIIIIIIVAVFRCVTYTLTHTVTLTHTYTDKSATTIGQFMINFVYFRRLIDFK